MDLSRLALSSPEVSAALAASDEAAALAELRTSPHAEAAVFVSAYDAFIEHFGHRSVMEGELSQPTWSEDTKAVFGLIRNLRDTGSDGNPYVAEERQRERREAATADALRRLAPPRRQLFRLILAEAQRYIANREQTKSLLVKGTSRARVLVRHLGQRLTADGHLGQLQDVFFLDYAEVKQLARGDAVPDLRERVQRRKMEHERNRDVVLPEAFRGRPVPITVEPPAATLVLRGIPVSPGRVSGPARVILDPRDDARLYPGEVLIAPVTDAGWTPLFLTAAAVVVDVGGPLSHGATVARELGLPAVVNVKQGTKLIRTGQQVTVDGRAGTVEVGEVTGNQ